MRNLLPKFLFKRVKKTADVGKTTVVLHLKGGTMTDGLTYEGGAIGGAYGMIVDSKSVAEGAVEKAGRNHFFELRNGMYLNVDQVLKVTFKTVSFKVEYEE
jgi:hypothetical protein